MRKIYASAFPSTTYNKTRGSSLFSVELAGPAFQLGATACSSIPKGLDHSAQRWPDSERAYAGLPQGKVPTLKGLHINDL
jgi:hypothetical protein